jgi:hypothetical protein
VVRTGTVRADGRGMHERDVWIELETMQQRMGHVLEQLQQVHAKLASTAVTADRVFNQMSVEHALSAFSAAE